MSDLKDCLISPNETDSNHEAANVVDGLFAIARALHAVARAIQNSSDGLERKLASLGQTVDGITAAASEPSP